MNSKTIKRSEKSRFSADKFSSESTKERITTLIDEDVVDWMRAEAKKTGIGYQTFLNIQLRALMNATKKGRASSGLGIVEFNDRADKAWSVDFENKLNGLIELKVNQKIDQKFKAAGPQLAASGGRAKARRK